MQAVQDPIIVTVQGQCRGSAGSAQPPVQAVHNPQCRQCSRPVQAVQPPSAGGAGPVQLGAKCTPLILIMITQQHMAHNALWIVNGYLTHQAVRF